MSAWSPWCSASSPGTTPWRWAGWHAWAACRSPSQPLTLAWSALLLGEHVGWLTAAAAAAVIVAAAVGRNARVDLAPETAAASRPDLAAAAAELRPAASHTSQLSVGVMPGRNEIIKVCGREVAISNPGRSISRSLG